MKMRESQQSAQIGNSLVLYVNNKKALKPKGKYYAYRKFGHFARNYQSKNKMNRTKEINIIQYIYIRDRQEPSYLEELDINKPGQDIITLIPNTADKQQNESEAKSISQWNIKAPIPVNTPEENRKKFEQKNWTIKGKPCIYK